MINPDKICMGCLKPVGEGKCRVCGFDRQEYEKNRSMRILPTATVLHGRYLVGKTLGIGGFGITYLVMDLEKEERVAVKEYFPNGLAERTVTGMGGRSISVSGDQQRQYYQKGLNSFVKEAATLRTFKDLEGIVQVYDFFRENNTGYLVMQYLPGMSLRAYTKIRGLPLKEEKVLELIWPVINSLAMIHRKGVIHRDISPDNIIYGTDHSITLIDFGAARQSSGDSNKSLTIMLKRGYAPMEQYYTKGRQGPWTDIYAICATVYYLLSGKVPPDSISRFAADSLLPLREMNENVSVEVSDAIQKGLSVNIENRYQTMEELIAELYAGKYVEEGSKSTSTQMMEGEDKPIDVRQQSEPEGQDIHKAQEEDLEVEKEEREKPKPKYPVEEWENVDSILVGVMLLFQFFSYIAVKVCGFDFNLVEWLLLSGVAAISFQIFWLRRLGIQGWMISLPVSCALVIGYIVTQVIYMAFEVLGYWTLIFYYEGFLSGILSVIWMIWYICLGSNKKGRV